MGYKRMLLNVMRVALPEGYPVMRTRDTEYLLRRCRRANILGDESMSKPFVCWEQNVGMIRKDLFDNLGGYDEATFKNWGFNNQDLCLRVIMAGGRVSSNIKRTINDKRLFCFAPFHSASRSKWHAAQEFKSKWGEEFSQDFITRVLNKQGGDIEQYRESSAV